MAKIIQSPSPCCDFCGRGLADIRKMIRGRVGGFPSFICSDCILDCAIELFPEMVSGSDTAKQRKLREVIDGN